MKKVRRIAAVAAAAMAFVGMSTMVAAPATAHGTHKSQGPKPVSQLLRAVDAGEDEWVSVWFKTDRKVCDFKMRVWDNNRVDIHHPGGWPFTSLNQNSTLRRNEVDYASFRVTADVDHDQWILLGATITFNYCGWHDETQVKTTGFVLPVDA